MKLSTLAVSLLTAPLGLTNAQAAAGLSSAAAVRAGAGTGAQYKRMSQLRGVSLSSSPKQRSAVRSTITFSDPNDAELLKTCAALAASDSCDANDVCTWCEAGAVPNECVPVQMAGKLPQGVFRCSKSAHSSKEVELESIFRTREADSSLAETLKGVVEEALEVVEEQTEKASKSQTFHLKEGVTLTLSTDAVDKDFCDSSSPLSLAGYMSGELLTGV